MAGPHYSIKAVARRTNLSPHVIRIWEKRYGAVTPFRTGTNRRLYSEEDTRRLGLLKQATDAGHRIGAIAGLSTAELLKIADTVQASPPVPEMSGDPAGAFVARSVQAIRELNTKQLEDILTEAIVALGQHGLLERVIGPLAQTIGELWRNGSIMAAHEHFASAVIRSFLARNSRPFTWNQDMPVIIVATPSGQLHELGAVMVAAAANDIGWRVVYLGTSLPAADIAGAAVQNRARAVALSIVYPEDDPNLPTELENLRRYLPGSVKVVAGGRAVECYGDALNRIGAVRPSSLGELYKFLESLRRAGRIEGSARAENNGH